MSRRNQKPGPLAQLHARLNTAGTTETYLLQCLDFLRAPDNASFADLLGLADELLLQKDLHRHPLIAAELRLWRARLGMHIDSGNYESASQDLEIACSDCAGIESMNAARLLIAIATQFNQMAQPGRAIDVYRSARQVCIGLNGGESEPSGRPEMSDGRANLLAVLAEAFAGEGENLLVMQSLQAALEAHYSALRLREQIGRTELVAASMAAVAQVYAELHDLGNARDYLERSLNAARVCEEKGALARHAGMVYEILAEVSLTMKELKEARDQGQRARAIYQVVSDPVAIARTHILAGRICEAELRPADAQDEYAWAYRILDRYRKHRVRADEGFAERRLLAAVQLAAGRLHRRMGNNDAKFVLLNALHDAEEIGDRRVQRDAHLELSMVYRSTSRCDKALSHYEAAIAIAHQLGDEQHRRALAEMQAEFDAERARRNEELLREAQRDAVRRKQELKVTALRLNEHTRIMQTLHDDLASALLLLAKRSGNEARERIEKMRKEINKALNASQEHWDQLLARLLDVDPGFMTCLEEKHTELTKSELEVCALVRLRLSAQEIANTRGGKPSTVYTHRLRISRKIGLESSNDLEDYLESICT